MSSTQWRDGAGVIDRLLHEPQQFGFFQAVRLLDRWLRPDAQDASGLARIRFRSSISLAFPASEIEALQVCSREQVSRADDGICMAVVAAAPGQGMAFMPAGIDHVELTPAFMGILGVNGTMPLFYTEMLAQREYQYKDHGARAFMDIFGSRAVSLFYQAWRKHRLPMQYESDRRHGFTPMVLSLAGLGGGGRRDRLGANDGLTADEALAYYAGTLQQRTLSSRQLQQVLQQHFGVAVRIDQFVGRWYDLPVNARCSLGRSSQPGILGRSVMLGERVWQRDLRVRLVLGPLTHERFRRFLPGEPGALALKSLLTLLGGVSLEYEINLQLQKQDIQGCELNSQSDPTGSRLGWDTFLQTRPATEDRLDVRYDIHESA